MEWDLPSELLACILLFVRGPAASGALMAARLVCRWWRDVVDAHLRLEPTREPYCTAFQWGYLSPAPFVPLSTNTVVSKVNDVIAAAVGMRDSRLLAWLEAFVDRHGATLWPEKFDYMLRRTKGAFGARETLVALGKWEGLTRSDIESVARRIHPADVSRARQLGVKVASFELADIFMHAYAKEDDYAGWTDEELRRALTDRTPHARIVPWLLRRGVVDASTVGRCLTSVIKASAWTGLQRLIDAIEARGQSWCAPIITAHLLELWARVTARANKRSERRVITEMAAWSHLARLLALAGDAARHGFVWQWAWGVMRSCTKQPESLNEATTVLEWLRARGYLESIHADFADVLSRALTRQAAVGGAAADRSDRCMAWQNFYGDMTQCVRCSVVRNPNLTSGSFLAKIAPDADRGEVRQQCPLSWVLFELMVASRAPFDFVEAPALTKRVVEPLLAAGNRFPADLNDKLVKPAPRFSHWAHYFAIALDCGYDFTPHTFSEGFLCDLLRPVARAGHEVLGKLHAQGIPIPPRVYQLAYRYRPPACDADNADVGSGEAFDVEHVTAIAALGMPPPEATFRELANAVVARKPAAFLAHARSHAAEEARVAMECLRVLAKFEPPTCVCEILEDASHKEALSALRALGYP